MAASMALLVALFVVLSSNDVISQPLKGLTMSYTIQVNLDSKQVWVPFGFWILPARSNTEVCMSTS